ncbi:MAG TPA: hypothetical protein VK281_13880, partial [Xanthobacteraceae bacterium]|nr:hypothetical protein [Xanthobacteraceae bacterium]
MDGYLSAADHDALATSCAVTTLAADVTRSNDRARSAYTRQVGIYLETRADPFGAQSEPMVDRDAAHALWRLAAIQRQGGGARR